MALMTRPEVTKNGDGSKFFEHTYEKFYLKAMCLLQISGDR